MRALVSGRLLLPAIVAVATPILPGRPAMRGRLRAAGIDAALIVIPDTPHPFWLLHPGFDPMLRATDEFLARHLRPAKPTSPRPSTGP